MQPSVAHLLRKIIDSQSIAARQCHKPKLSKIGRPGGGANFLVIEHYLILALFQKLYVYRDALVLGAISFLIISGLGSTFITPRLRPVFQFAGGLFILLLLIFHENLSPWQSLALLAPVAFVTGSFFPALFEAAAENPLGVFAADSIGAAIGSMASFFIPIVFGFSWFFAFRFSTSTFYIYHIYILIYEDCCDLSN